MAEFKISRFKYTWRGEWAFGNRYNPDDVVSFGSKVYICLVSHTANANFYADLNFQNGDVPPITVPRWELNVDAVTWLGDWTPNTYFKQGDQVKVNGIIYQCITPHTSKTPTAGQNVFQAFTVDVAYWVVQISSQDWKIDWTVDTYYTVNDIVRYGGTVYRCTTSHRSAGSNITGLEADIDKWTAINIADDWKGNWGTAVKYKVRDIVRYGGRVYQCTVAHTSNSAATNGLPADQGKWSLVFDGIEHKGSFTYPILYKPNDVVKYGSYLYKATTLHTSASSFVAANWEILCPGQEYDVTFSLLTVYQPGDIVKFGGNLYSSLVLQNATTPENTGTWELLFENSRIRGEFANGVDYFPGDVVRRGGNVYIAKVSLLGSSVTTPDLYEDGSSTNSGYWDLVIPGVAWRGVWHADAFYNAGDTVVWVSSSYRCLDRHYSTNQNRPDDDQEDGSTLRGRYWQKITDGFVGNRMKYRGDLRTYGPTEDGSTVGFTRIPVGNKGQVIRSTNGQATWTNFWESQKVYWVGPTGEDSPTNGTTQNSPWKTIRYALENVTGYATIFVRTGVYEEVLPLRVPAFVAVVGDELRSTVVRPANNLLDSSYMELILAAITWFKVVSKYVVTEVPVGTLVSGYTFAPLFGDISQDFSAGTASNTEVQSIETLIETLQNSINNYTNYSITGTNTETVNANRIAAHQQLTNNKAFIKNEITLSVSTVYVDSSLTALPSRWSQDLDRIIDAVIYDLRYPGNYKTVELGRYFINASNGARNKSSNMFLLRDGTGLRNMTLTGLSGVLTPPVGNLAVTQRVSAGAYASLDPGWGPSDTTVWVGTKSPYVQNVTTFGDGCIGLKIDGDLHGGGNQTIVANDFTQILSDGIGVWCNGAARTELVSIFTYYCHIGYLATTGGKIRGTNGNCSYGQFGAVGDGYNLSEVPITASVTNRYYEANTSQILCDDSGGVSAFFYANAGTTYTTATTSVSGAGVGSTVRHDDFRQGSTYEVRVTDPGDSTVAGGSGYTFVTNAAQGGTTNTIQIAGSDQNTAATYRGLRVVVQTGKGTGQYGYIAEYDATSKTIFVGNESSTTTIVTASTSTGNLLTMGSNTHLNVGDPIVFVGTKFGNIVDYTIYYVASKTGSTQITISASSSITPTFGLINGSGSMVLHKLGWEHFVPGTVIENTLDATSYYYIEPRLTFSSPGFSTLSSTLPASRQWTSIASNGTIAAAVALDYNRVATTTDGVTWITTATLPVQALWTKIKYVGDRFMAFATGGQAAYSTDGATWTSMSMPSTAEWRDVAYGLGEWVAVANGGTKAAVSTNGVTWTASTLPDGGDWNCIEFGKNKFLATAIGDSSLSVPNTAYKTPGINTWTTGGTLTQSNISLVFGNNRFVALSGGYGGANEVSVSFDDGTTWIESSLPASQNWQKVVYGNGLFIAIANNYANVAVSKDGRVWTLQSIPTGSPWCDINFVRFLGAGRFFALSGLTTNSSVGLMVLTGATTQARPVLTSGRVSAFRIWEPGGGYTSAPVLTVTDPNNSGEVIGTARIGNGVLGQPTITAAGSGYSTTSTSSLTTGDGYRDQYQTGTSLVVTGLTRIPGPGDNVNINGINDYTYKLLTATVVGGSVGNYTAILTIAKDLGINESPDHDTPLTIRQQYSQVRLTGHDFLDIGLGTFIESNYPDTLNPIGTVVSPEDEVTERNGGRVFYTATDQDGNFRCGELFAVEQATGTVTLNAQFFSLSGLEELRLGGVTVGGSGVVIREFSTDSLFTADSNNIIPTQKAIKAYLNRRVSGGGSDAVTGGVTVGVTQVGPDSLSTTSGEALIFESKVNFKGGVDGTLVSTAFYIAGGAL